MVSWYRIRGEDWGQFECDWLGFRGLKGDFNGCEQHPENSNLSMSATKKEKRIGKEELQKER